MAINNFNDTISQRIKKVRLVKNLTQQAFANSLGISQGYLSEIEKGIKQPSDTLLIAIQYLYKINKDWLLTGEGEMFIGRPEVAESYNKQGTGEDFILVPVMSGEISAGGGLIPDETIELRLAFRRDWIKRHGDPRNMSLIRVKGDSMEPTFYSGDLVLVDHSKNYLDPQGGVYAISIDNHIMIKRLQILYPERKIKVISDNPKYESFIVNPDELIINGKVIWFAREIER